MDADLLAKQWELVKGAPVIFGLAIAGLAIGMWWLFGIRWRGKIDGLAGQVDALNAQIGTLNERLKLAHEKNDTAKQEFQSLKAEMDRRESQYSAWRDFDQRVLAPRSPQLPEEHSLSTSVHSINLDRLLTDVSSATAGTAPFEYNPFWKKK